MSSCRPKFQIGHHVKGLLVGYRPPSVKNDHSLPFLSLQSIWPQDCLLLNIWHARLFPAFPDARESLKYACDMINCLKDGQSLNSKFSSFRLYSMADILREKDIDGIFDMRTEIRKAILS